MRCAILALGSRAALVGALIVQGVSAQVHYVKAMRPIREQIRDKIPISGADFRVGLMAFDSTKGISGDTVYAWINGSRLPREQRLCVAITSFDGIYEADVEFGIPSNLGTKGVLAVVLEASHPEYIRRYSPNQLAIRATLERECSPAERGRFAIAAWHPTAKPETPLLVIRSGALRVDVVDRGANKTQIRCNPTNDQLARRFDLICSLPTLQGGHEEYKFEIHRFNGIIRLKDVQLSIVSPRPNG
jgi:hypothetical protein